MNLQNEILLDSIRFSIAATATWRRGMADRYPDDPRNLRGADALDRLAADAISVTSTTWALIKPHVASTALRGAVSDVARDISFRGEQPETLDAFLAAVTARLSSQGKVTL
jgi:hypothetical protein